MTIVPEDPPISAQCNALVVALIYERAGEPTFRGSRGVNGRTIEVLVRRGLMERDERQGYRLTDPGRALGDVAQGRAGSRGLTGGRRRHHHQGRAAALRGRPVRR